MDQNSEERFILLQSCDADEECGQFPDPPLVVEGEGTSDTLYNPPGELDQTQPYRTMYQYVNLSQEAGVERYTLLPRQYLLQTSGCGESCREGVVTLTMDGSAQETRSGEVNYMLSAQPMLCVMSEHRDSDAASFVLSQPSDVDVPLGNHDGSCEVQQPDATVFDAIVAQPDMSDRQGKSLTNTVPSSACSTTEPVSLHSLPLSDSLIIDDVICNESESRILGGSDAENGEKGSSQVPEGEETQDQPHPQTLLAAPVGSSSHERFQVFSTVRARLSQSLLEAIPGSKAAYLHSSTSGCQVVLRQEDNTFELSGSLSSVVEAHDKLQSLFGLDGEGTRRGTEDKGVHCCLLKPRYSRSGREVKWRTMDISDDEAVADSADSADVRPRVTRRAATRKKRKARRQPTAHPSEKQRSNDRVTEELKTEEVGSDHIEMTVSKTEGEETAAGPDSLVEDDVPTVEADPPKNRDSDGDTDPDLTNAKSPEASEEPCVVLGRPKHKKNYDELNPFKFFCDQSSFKSKRRNHLERHRKVHDSNLPVHKCKLCPFTSMRKGHLQRHQMSHSAQVYSCPKCKYQTSNSHYLYKHYRLKHNLTMKKDTPSPTPTVLSCEYCDYKTDRPLYYERHMKCHLVSDPEKGDSLVPDYSCATCSYRTRRKEHYVRHMNNVHMDRRPYLCDHCGKAFKRRDALKQHHLVHEDVTTRIYPFTCHVCMKGFRSQAHLSEHQTRHSAVRSYLCEVCGASFKTKSVQRHHVTTIHSNPRSFHCDQCEKRFNTRYALRRHQSIHDTATVRLLEQMVVQQQKQQTVEVVMDQQVIAELQPSAGDTDIMSPDDKIVQTISMPVTIVSSQSEGTVTYEQETGVADVHTAYAQTSEATTALLYLTNYQTY